VIALRSSAEGAHACQQMRAVCQQRALWHGTCNFFA
jgi:hypothetical protein